MSSFQRKYLKIAMLIILDIVFISIALIGASYLSDNEALISTKLITMAVFFAVTLKVIIFVRVGFYRAILKYASIDFLAVILKGSTLGTCAIILLFYFIGPHFNPRVYVIDWLLTTIFMGGSRFAIRYHLEYLSGFRKGKKVLIYGAGDLGVMALRQLKHDKSLSYTPVGFIDDDIKKGDSVIQNIKVLGRWSEFDKIQKRVAADELVVAIANISGDKMRDIVKECRHRKIMCRVVPSFPKMLAMEPMVRSLEISDLLRRSPRDLDKESISRFLDSKRILITGAAGSIGSEIVRQCLKYNPKEIIALDQSEEGLYHLKEEFNSITDDIDYVLADVSSLKSIESVFLSYKPQIIFHAAAYKHVPMLEDNINEAVINNIAGTENVTNLSSKYGAEKFVLISTDKAVRPSSVMGATKRACELLIQNYTKKNGTEYVAVRFGNVLGSSGSVVPKFVEQIRAGGPVTVTHPETTRFFMLTSEAVQLVLQAASVGEDGNIYILDMGKPVKILEMAEDLIYLMGREPHKDIQIEFTGLRPGEKIYEELFSEEIDHGTQYENITVAKATKLQWDHFKDSLDNLFVAAHEGNRISTLQCLCKLVPNFNQPEPARVDGFEFMKTNIRENKNVIGTNHETAN